MTQDDRTRISKAPEGAETARPDDSEGEKEKSGLRPAQIVAGGVAATTAAFLCSFLGVYGTVIGAGAISVLSTVGSELYLRSARKSKEAAKKAKAKAAALAEAKGRTAVLPSAKRNPAAQAVANTAERNTAEHRASAPDPRRDAGATRTMALPGASSTRSWSAPGGPDQPTRRILSNADQPTDYLGVPAAADTSGGDSARGSWLKRRWPVLAATSAVVFAIGLFVVTGFELATGQSLNGQGRSTVSQIVGDRGHQHDTGGGVEQEQRDDVDAPAPSTSTEGTTETEGDGSATPTEQPTESSTPAPQQPEPTDTAEPTETEQPGQTEVPTEQPTEQPQTGGDGGAGTGAGAETP